MLNDEVKIKRFCCSTNWTIKTQVLGFSILFIILSIGIISAILYSSLYFIKDIIIEGTLIIEEKETINQMTLYNSLQSRSFQRLLDFSYNTLNNINKLNHFIEQNNQTFEIVLPLDCIDDLSLNDSYIYQCSLCYKFCNKTQPINYQNNLHFFQLISFITEALPILNIYRQTFFTSTSDEQFFTVYKGGDYTTFTAHIRPWYIEHMQNLITDPEAYYLSSLYLDWIHKLVVAFTVSLVDLENNLIGVLGYDLGFDLLPNFVDSHIQMDIVNSTGHLLVSEYYLTILTPLVIFNESITGLNEEDWIKMKKFGDQQKIGKGTLTIKNKISNTLKQVSVYKLNYPEIYIIIYQTDDQFIIDQKIILQNLKAIDKVILQYTLDFTVCLIIIVSFFQFFIISYVLRNLKQLLLVTKQQIFIDQQLKKQQLIIQQKEGNSIQKLCKSFLHLNTNLTWNKQKKSTLCQNIQHLKYPQKISEVDCYAIDYFTKHTRKMKDEMIELNYPEPRQIFWKLYLKYKLHRWKHSQSFILQKINKD